MQGQNGFWDVEDRLKELSAEGDPLEKFAATVDFEMFRPVLRTALVRMAGGKGGRPGFDPALKFKMLVLQSLQGLSLAQASCMVRDRLSWTRFCGLVPGDTVPDANTLYLPMGGQIIDATLVAAPKQRNTDGEKVASRRARSLRSGRTGLPDCARRIVMPAGR